VVEDRDTCYLISVAHMDSCLFAKEERDALRQTVKRMQREQEDAAKEFNNMREARDRELVARALADDKHMVVAAAEMERTTQRDRANESLLKMTTKRGAWRGVAFVTVALWAVREIARGG